MQQRKALSVAREAVGQGHDDREDHGRGADHGSANQYGLGRSFEGVARAVVLFQQVLGALEHDSDVMIALELFDDVRLMLN